MINLAFCNFHMALSFSISFVSTFFPWNCFRYHVFYPLSVLFCRYNFVFLSGFVFVTVIACNSSKNLTIYLLSDKKTKPQMSEFITQSMSAFSDYQDHTVWYLVQQPLHFLTVANIIVKKLAAKNTHQWNNMCCVNAAKAKCGELYYECFTES